MTLLATQSNPLTALRAARLAGPSSAVTPSAALPALQTPLALPLGFPQDVLEQRRWKARGNTYQPSTLKRKRVNGFLARLKTRGGRKVLARRKTKGRWFLSH